MRKRWGGELLASTFNRRVLEIPRLRRQFETTGRLLTMVPLRRLSYPHSLDYPPQVGDAKPYVQRQTPIARACCLLFLLAFNWFRQCALVLRTSAGLKYRLVCRSGGHQEACILDKDHARGPEGPTWYCLGFGRRIPATTLMLTSCALLPLALGYVLARERLKIHGASLHPAQESLKVSFADHSYLLAGDKLEKRVESCQST